jgi:hypothetical protein
MKFQRLIPLSVAVLVWILSQVFLIEPKFFYAALAIGAVAIILGVKFIVGREKAMAWLPLIIAPLLFSVSFSAYAAIIVNRLLIQFVFLLVAWFNFVYLKNLYYYFIHNNAERAARLDNLLAAGGFLTMFAATAVLFALPAFLNWSLLVTLPMIAVLSGLTFVQFLPIKKIAWSATAAALLLNVLILTELAGAFSLWPLNFNVLALLFAIVYYLSLSVMRLYWSDNLRRRALKLPLILSIIAVLLLILTARWF